MTMKHFMKRWLMVCMLAVATALAMQASDDCPQHLTKEEFRARQQAFITERANLTPQEAEQFFPLYFELQDRKKALNDETWHLIKQGQGEHVGEAKYEEILEGMYDNRMATERLEKSYFEKFRRVLSCKKIYEVQRAEMRFHREILKGFGNKEAHGKNSNRKKD